MYNSCDYTLSRSLIVVVVDIVVVVVTAVETNNMISLQRPCRRSILSRVPPSVLRDIGNTLLSACRTAIINRPLTRRSAIGGRLMYIVRTRQVEKKQYGRPWSEYAVFVRLLDHRG